MEFGYSTNAFVRFSLFEAIEKIAGLGFRAVEIMGDRPHFYPGDFTREELSRLRALLRHYGLKVTNLNSFTLFAVGDTYLPSWIEPEQERREIRIRHTRQCLRRPIHWTAGTSRYRPAAPWVALAERRPPLFFTRG